MMASEALLISKQNKHSLKKVVDNIKEAAEHGYTCTYYTLGCHINRMAQDPGIVRQEISFLEHCGYVVTFDHTSTDGLSVYKISWGE